MERESAVVTVTNEAEVTLAERIRAGDRSAEDELVNTYRRGVFVIAVARTRDREAARDLTQEVLIAILEALLDGQLRELAKLSALIKGTARNLHNNYRPIRSTAADCTTVVATN